MRDRVSLVVGGKMIENFLSYRITSNLFEAADGFELSLANPKHEIEEGALCKLYINDRLELNGIIDLIKERGNKRKRSLDIEGRDLMGLVVDSYAEDYEEKKNESLKDLANRILAPIKQINRKDIQYGEGSKDRAVPVTGWLEDFEITEIEPAKTIFEILKPYATSRGLLFFSLPNGTFVFGKPITSGSAEFTLINKKDGRNNNVFEWERIRDISKRYSKVTVHGERQGTDALGVGGTHVSASIQDDTFPEHLYKPFVASINQDAKSPKKYAKVLMEKQQFEGFSLTYKTKGHSQNGKNYQVNAMCHVNDENLKPSAKGSFLIYSRTFEMNREDGVFTHLKLSKPGVLPV